MDEIVAKFDEEGPETGLPLTETEEALKMARSLEVVELVGKVSGQIALNFAAVVKLMVNFLLFSDERSRCSSERDHGCYASR